MPDVKNLRAVARWLRGASAAPHLHGAEDMPKWDQRLFYQFNPDCGTTCCIAGYVATVLGHGKPVPATADERSRPVVSGTVEVDGRLVPIEDYAQNLLGLTGHQANTLFYKMSTDPAEIIDYLSEYAGEDLSR